MIITILAAIALILAVAGLAFRSAWSELTSVAVILLAIAMLVDQYRA